MAKYLDSLSRRRGKTEREKKINLVLCERWTAQSNTNTFRFQPIPLLSTILCVLAAWFYQFKRRNEWKSTGTRAPEANNSCFTTDTHTEQPYHAVQLCYCESDSVHIVLSLFVWVYFVDAHFGMIIAAFHFFSLFGFFLSLSLLYDCCSSLRIFLLILMIKFGNGSGGLAHSQWLDCKRYCPWK